jgi:uncharacterized phage infection (PIP) family protein YhgE
MTIPTPENLQASISSASGVVASAQQALGAGCGVGSALSQINSSIRQASEAINNAISTANDIISAVQNLPNIITQQVSGVISTAITNALGPVRELNALANQIQAEVANLLRLVNNPAAFLAQYLNIQRLFPNLDLNGLLNRILSGMNICQATAEAAGTAPQHGPPTVAAQGAPPAVQTPEAPQPTTIPNLSYQSQITRERLDPPPGVRDATPTQVEESILQIRRDVEQRLGAQYWRLSLQRNYTRPGPEYDNLTQQMLSIRQQLESQGLLAPDANPALVRRR